MDDWLTQEPAPEHEDVEHIAKDLGRFLAEFVVLTREPNIELLSLFPSNSSLINQTGIYQINNLKTVFLSHGVPDADILIKRVEDAMKDYWNFELCLGMVDLWRNNIFIDSNKNICLVDWEYFGLSNASHEMGLLGRFFFIDFLDGKPFPFSDILHTNSPIITLDLIKIKFFGRCDEVRNHIH
jgi:hypothetical protein